MAINACSYILITGYELLAVNALQMQLVLVLVATAALFSQGLFGKRRSHVMRFSCMAGSAIDKPVGSSIYSGLINIERDFLPIRQCFKKLRVAVTCQAGVIIKPINLIG
jgi:hypothetical protein